MLANTGNTLNLTTTCMQNLFEKVSMKSFKRIRYVRAMMKAIKLSCKDILTGRVTSKTYGLRCIRTFERVNDVVFDPFDKSHVDCISGMANHEEFFRKAKRILKQ